MYDTYNDSEVTITLCLHTYICVFSKIANDTEEAQKLQEDQLAMIEKLEMQKALLQVWYIHMCYNLHVHYNACT